ncbi:folylpolyglutamate synthase/dihydrofolate synthase family protein [Lactobacillus hamsteri]|uniref:tetrahydrofolate synthase n=1 Tax=Lactobacillus hamsteri DSM 5661 = JCM 6256 TaxID=1423754 RepID=A0A0R1Y4L2_9LACO|nr:folylpolyglutamate synthase/dihydrofolate synthase family protein [Lactobacillus hamsteri]KRM37234.1 FolC family protein [Lactobacillus hamsteri DSM 5661 = JCM 6256]
MKFKDAEDVIDHIYSLPNLHPKNDLSYIKRVLDVLDNPQNKVKTIHVTGTNGKGSTTYYLSNLLKKAGQKTGLFVSPYINKFNERIQLNGNNIPDNDLVTVANEVENAIIKLRLSDPNFSLVTFEYETVMAFLYFAKQKCDYAVIEVGIGGEHDKTNVITPEVSVITTIGLDHEKIIGPTIQDIAKEKSGIIKHNRPVVLGNIPDKVLSILEKKSGKEQSKVYLLNRDYQVTDEQQIEYRYFDKEILFDKRPQVESYDIAIALTAFYLLKVDLSDKKIQQAINATQIPGRYQLVQKHPDIVLDGAHNIQAMKNLLEFVHKQNKILGGKVKVLITMMKDKDLDQVFSLFNESDQITLTTIPYPRAAKLADFPIEVREKYNYAEDYQVAYKNLKNDLNVNDILLVTGSFYLVGAILNMEEH